MALSIKGSIVLNYLEKYPHLPTRTLSNKIYTENKAVFASYENTRSVIRYYKGVGGAGNRKAMLSGTNTSFAKEPGTGYTLPKSRAETWRPYFVPKNFKLGAVFSDLHIPYHDPKAVNAAIGFCKTMNPDFLILNGDIIDCYQLSKYQKDPRKRNFKGELSDLKSFIGYMRQEFPEIHIIYKIGNHEERYSNYMATKAPELYDIEEFQFPVISGIIENEIECVDKKRIIKHDQLNIVHGHEFFGSANSPVNPARGFFLKGLDIVLGSHFHRPTTHTEMTLSGKPITCWSTGCLCNLRPHYGPINKWIHGFSIIDTSRGQRWTVKNYKIFNGEVYDS